MVMGVIRSSLWRPVEEENMLRRSAMIVFAVLGAMGLAGPALAQAAKDKAGCADHPVVSRFAGAIIQDCTLRSYDEYFLANKRAGTKLDESNSLKLAGKVTSNVYLTAEGATSVEVLGNYRQALTGAGFQILYECEGKSACGSLVSFPIGPARAYWSTLDSGLLSNPNDGRYLAAKLSRAGAEVYAMVLSVQSGSTLFNKRRTVVVDVIEPRPLETGKVTVDAAAMSKGLAAEGKIALYGVYFDTNKSEIKPESKAQMDEIAKLLTNDPKLNILVVGHTDSTGDYAANLALSKARADAVTAALVRDYRIAASRLTAVGVGMAAPVASNDQEQGRSRNRRVEIVKR
jgi:outer membrane protein OmpA-like peptidoglycan-associated protein